MLVTAAGQRTELGHNLLDVLRDEAGSLADSLPTGVSAPVVQGRPGGSKAPRRLRGRPDYQPPPRAVRWSDADRADDMGL